MSKKGREPEENLPANRREMGKNRKTAKREQKHNKSEKERQEQDGEGTAELSFPSLPGRVRVAPSLFCEKARARFVQELKVETLLGNAARLSKEGAAGIARL